VKVLSVTSSLTRRPLAYISSSIVRSRRPSGVSTSGAASSILDLRFAQRLGHAQRLLGGLQPQRRVGVISVRAGPSGSSA
jgi:hypothetical protein